jgi:hypothetical protein
VCCGEPCYPEILANIDDAPPVLTQFGHSQLLAAAIVAIVGACNASANWRRLAAGSHGRVCRGGRRGRRGHGGGIDWAANGEPLSTGSIAVVARGIDIVYPPANRGLYDTLARDGAIIAELPFAPNRRRGTSAPQPHRLGYVVWPRCRRGGGEIGVADHRPIRSRAGRQGIRIAQRAARSEEPRSCATARH